MRRGRSAQVVVAFQNQHGLSGFGQIRRCDQAIVATADNDRVIVLIDRAAMWTVHLDFPGLWTVALKMT